MRNLLRCSLLVTSILALAACGDSGTNPTPTLDGAWRGQVVPSDAPIFDMELTLAETSAGDLTGTGAIIVTEGNITVTLGLVVESGSHNHPAFSMRLGSSELDLEDFTFSGELEDGQLVGELNGSGFSRVPATLSRR